MGDIGDGYPNGTVYVSNFTGKFTNIKKIDDYTYEMELEECTTANTIGTEEIEDGIRYVYSEPYGISGGETFYLYLPGKPISELSEGFIGWAYGVIGDISNDSEIHLVFIGLDLERIWDIFMHQRNPMREMLVIRRR